MKDGTVTDDGLIGGRASLSAVETRTLTRLRAGSGFYTENLSTLGGDYRLTAIRGLDGDTLITESRLFQVLTNLAGNAARHTPDGTRVTITLTRGPDTIELSVTDDGPGIPPVVAAHLFERFARGDSARSREPGSRESGSTGLGLSIADAVTTAHGGSIGASSGPGCTRFTVTLPSLGTMEGCQSNDCSPIPTPRRSSASPAKSPSTS